MYGIVFRHYLLDGNGTKFFQKFKRQLTFLHSFIDWDIDAFILISGIVGYKKNKYSNLIYLWLTVFFYSVGIHKYVLFFKKNYIVKEEMYKEYYPMVFKRFGVYYFHDGKKYIAEFKNNKKEGKGIYYYKDGRVYQGIWKNNKKERIDEFYWGNLEYL